jgi:diguanylate cyclase (GGDEF)-like protein
LKPQLGTRNETALRMGWSEMAFDTGVNSEAKKFFELLAMMTVGACWWFVGSASGLFDVLTRFAASHGLMNLMLLCACISLGGIVAVVRTMVHLRRAVAARIAAEAAAERVARQDALTGLGNRRFFNEKMTAMLAARGPEQRFAVLLIDLDRFKPVNDVHGHAAGNAVLCAVAERLLQKAPAGSVVARLGGDEFVALVPGLEIEAGTGELAQRMIDSIRQPIPWRRGFVDVDATIGIAVADGRTTDPEALLHAADIAMYQGKRQGRGMWRFFRPEMDEALKTRAKIEGDLRSAIQGGHIKPFYQPIVSLQTRALVGFEVLSRWEHPSLGEISPQIFIPIAEESGLISDLFARVLKAACLDARSWPGHIQISVNISPLQIQDPQMPEKILSVLTKTRFPARRLEVELTEKALINDIETARVALTSLQNIGVGIALDNFGAGYSILRHLSQLRFNKIKIDRSYVAELKPGGDRVMLLDAIVQLGANLSLQTTAEGIETPENLEWLSKAGCSFGQGFLFGRAMSPGDAAAYIARSVPQVPRARDSSVAGLN